MWDQDIQQSAISTRLLQVLIRSQDHSRIECNSQVNQIQTFCCFLQECPSQAVRYFSCSLLSHITPAVTGQLTKLLDIY